MNFGIGLSAINSYKRLSYSPWHALAEFIDNSTQSYFDHKAVLDLAFAQEEVGLEVNVLYDRASSTLTIIDNAMGMSLDEVDAALQVAVGAPSAHGRCRYGMGMKTAACWFGNRWQIKTKRLGEPEEITVVVDVPQIAGGNSALAPAVVDTGDMSTHYTEITVQELHKNLPSRTLGKIKEFLRSMYRCDLREGLLTLNWQNAPLSWEDLDDRILRHENGQPYKKSLGFPVLGHQVRGWVAVLASGGRPYAGFTILQNNRVIRGYPDAWRPTTLYGQLQGSNDLVNQRLVGEIHLDTFDVSHTKDDIVWAGEEEEALEDALLEACRDYRQVARSPRRGSDDREPGANVVDAAVDQLVRDLESDEIVDAIDLTDLPPEPTVDQVFKDVVSVTDRAEPRFTAQVGSTVVRCHLNQDASPNDPYYALDILPDETLVVVINMKHPYRLNLCEQGAMTDYLRQCVFDALAENKARIMRGRVHSNTVRTFKDHLLRVPHQMHDLEVDEGTLVPNAE